MSGNGDVLLDTSGSGDSFLATLAEAFELPDALRKAPDSPGSKQPSSHTPGSDVAPGSDRAFQSQQSNRQQSTGGSSGPISSGQDAAAPAGKRARGRRRANRSGVETAQQRAHRRFYERKKAAMSQLLSEVESKTAEFAQLTRDNGELRRKLEALERTIAGRNEQATLMASLSGLAISSGRRASSSAQTQLVAGPPYEQLLLAQQQAAAAARAGSRAAQLQGAVEVKRSDSMQAAGPFGLMQLEPGFPAPLQQARAQQPQPQPQQEQLAWPPGLALTRSVSMPARTSGARASQPAGVTAWPAPAGASSSAAPSRPSWPGVLPAAALSPEVQPLQQPPAGMLLGLPAGHTRPRSWSGPSSPGALEPVAVKRSPANFPTSASPFQAAQQLGMEQPLPQPRGFRRSQTTITTAGPGQQLAVTRAESDPVAGGLLGRLSPFASPGHQQLLLSPWVPAPPGLQPAAAQQLPEPAFQPQQLQAAPGLPPQLRAAPAGMQPALAAQLVQQLASCGAAQDSNQQQQQQQDAEDALMLDDELMELLDKTLSQQQSLGSLPSPLASIPSAGAGEGASLPAPGFAASAAAAQQGPASPVTLLGASRALQARHEAAGLSPAPAAGPEEPLYVHQLVDWYRTKLQQLAELLPYVEQAVPDAPCSAALVRAVEDLSLGFRKFAARNRVGMWELKLINLETGELVEAPPAHWRSVANRIHLSQEIRSTALACYSLYQDSVDKIRQERLAILQDLAALEAGLVFEAAAASRAPSSGLGGLGPVPAAESPFGRVAHHAAAAAAGIDRAAAAAGAVRGMALAAAAGSHNSALAPLQPFLRPGPAAVSPAAASAATGTPAACPASLQFRQDGYEEWGELLQRLQASMQREDLVANMLMYSLGQVASHAQMARAMLACWPFWPDAASILRWWREDERAAAERPAAALLPRAVGCTPGWQPGT